MARFQWSKKWLLVAIQQFRMLYQEKTCTLYHHCKGLYERYHYQIYAISFADEQVNKSLIKLDFLYTVEYIHVPKVLESFNNLLLNSLLGK